MQPEASPIKAHRFRRGSCTLNGMARAYRDGAELRIELVDRSIHPLVPEGTVIALGIGFPAVNEPIPLMLIPGNEYRIREVTGYSDSGDPLWLIERRTGGKGEAD